MNITSCRYCGSDITPVLDLGRIPLVNYFPSKDELQHMRTYPLALMSCDSCGLLQLSEIVPAPEIFFAYHYVTGASEPLIRELSILANSLIKKRHLTLQSTVLDIGSNDGTLLSFFHAKGIGVIGVEPSRELSAYSEARGIRTIHAFFSLDVAKQIVKIYGRCDVVCATHVLANIVDLGDFMEGIRTIVSDAGVCVIEVADAEVMISLGQFDAMYHEHYSYFTTYTLTRIAEDHGMSVLSITKSSVQGGAIRLELVHATASSLRKKAKTKPNTLRLDRFAQKVIAHKKQFLSHMAKYAGKKIVGFGAPAKSVTFIHAMGVSGKDISYIVDSTPQKQGKYLPGTTIPIYNESNLLCDPPDVVIVFAWNYRETIMKKLKKFCNKGTIVIVPFPTLQVFPLGKEAKK